MQSDAPSQGIEALYSTHYGWLRKWLHRKLGCAHQAADLAHDTFVRVLLRPSRDSLREPRAYLSTIAHGLVVNHWRRLEIERAYLDALLVLPESLAPSPEDRLMVFEALVAVDALLAELPDKVRRAFLLAQLDGMGYGEIATELGLSERTVKRHMVRALMHCLTASGGDAR